MKYRLILPVDVQHVPIVAEVRPASAAIFSPLFEQLQFLNGIKGGQCVAWLQKLLGFPKGLKGDAWKIRPITSYGQVGDIALLQNHVALIVGEIGEFWILAEANINEDERVLIGRTIPKSSPRGYIPLTSHLGG